MPSSLRGDDGFEDAVFLDASYEGRGERGVFADVDADGALRA
jgi:hypothetical protein